MPQLYTPFLAKAGAAIGRGLEKRGENIREDEIAKLASSAYMGDPQALQQLMQIDPQRGFQVGSIVQKRKEGAEQKSLAKTVREEKKQATEEKGKVDKRTRFNAEIKDFSTGLAKFNSYEEAKEYGERMTADLSSRYPDIMKETGADAIFDEEDFRTAKQLSGEDGGAYAGKGMEAQVSNILVKGVEDPEFRNTPEYARAWQLANEPKIIRTPTGDITLRPELSAIFKPPGPVKPEAQQIKESKEGVKKDVEVIPGTEKEIKTTADEKVSFGYYSRMTAAEKNIKRLGDFDSASIWERFKGVTNITASPELQQYRQAADDWIRAKLRRESGAVIGPQEMQKEYEIYFPQIGDSQAVMDQKKSARKEAENSMKVASGKRYKEPEKTPEGELKKMDVPAVGTVSGGHRFIGGDPAKPESWEKM